MPLKSSYLDLEWPRSDGDSSCWPQPSPPAPGKWYLEPAPLTDPKCALYEQKTAQSIAEFLKLDIDARTRMALPEGYKIFAYRRRQDDNTLRTKYYVYGSKNALRFQSTREWEPHAIWLFDASKDLNDHTQCDCPYSKLEQETRPSVTNSQKRKTLDADSTPSPSSSTPAKTSRGSGPSSSLSPPSQSPASHGKSRSEKRMSSTETEQGNHETSFEDAEDLGELISPSSAPERVADLQQKRKIRKGELVWFRIETIKPPPGSKFERIRPVTHWPALVFKMALDYTPSRPQSNSDNDQSHTHCNLYHLRPLGMFSPYDVVSRNSTDLLPWLAGLALFSPLHTWDHIYLAAQEILEEGARDEAIELNKIFSDPLELSKAAQRLPSWNRKWTKNIMFEDMEDWNTVVTRLAFAIQAAVIITTCWTLTDPISLREDDPDLSKEEIKAIAENRKRFYQGFYWGGERMWIEDMVRLKRPWSELQELHCITPSPGATEHCLFFRISKITAEASPDHTIETPSYRSLLYGDLFELVEEETETGAGNLAASAQKRDPGQPSVAQNYIAPKKFAYRQINTEDSEAVCDISDIAGRAYPDLLDHDKQNWFIDPHRIDMTEGRQEPDDHLLSIMGLKPGYIAMSDSKYWKVDLHEIVQYGSTTIRNKMRAFYSELVQSCLREN
ncbi:uncharacterized protein L203_100805 [Cryptococcus depauperatus CBS 7841]|uniref:Uncharacterized protein n=1 Tax=Cryptococcus depauperatus CBS 7841 TaxID=1295531 RepID=A0A1E3IXG1_9TREE|nr:hypothetical protein L203_00594 [Cryptococcus depauperatus CBS 7841]